MTNKPIQRFWAQNNRIKIIGDSLAAGAGSSLSRLTQELIFEDAGVSYYKREAPNSWWGLLSAHLKGCTVNNMGCGGAYSYQIRAHLDRLVSADDRSVLIFMGLNDRKRPGGMAELRENCRFVIDKLHEGERFTALLTPTPSTAENENYPNRLTHTEEVVEVLRAVAAEKQVPLVDNYGYITKYLKEKGLRAEDILYGEGCRNDGLHPPDFVQRMIFENLCQTLGI